MKSTKLFFIYSLGILLILSNCKPKDSSPEPVADQQFSKLAKTWKLVGVKLSTSDQSSTYKTSGANQFTLSFTGSKGNASSYSYTTTNNPSTRSVWKGSGAWDFGTDPKTMITRDPNTANKLDMTYVVTENTLVITFTFPKSSSGWDNQGRAEVIDGNWEFTFGL